MVYIAPYWMENFIEKMIFFCNNPKALAVVLYYDDLGVANPLASSSRTQKLSMFYWTLANIKPELCSSNNAIQLLAIVKTSYLKEAGASQKILEPFINDIKTQGIDISINGFTTNYDGSLLYFSGDTPASALIGSFKESVSAHRSCRTCMITKDELKLNFKESDFILRNINLHEEHLNAITHNTTKAAKNFWQLF